MKTLLAALVLLPGLASAQSSDSSFAAALCAVRAKAAASAKATPVKGAKPAAVRSEAKGQPAAPSIKLCDEAMGKHVTGSYGGPNLMLQTETMAYYTHQDCDICDELDSCELKTGKLATLKTAHMIGCEDIAPYRKGKISYDACGPIR